MRRESPHDVFAVYRYQSFSAAHPRRKAEFASDEDVAVVILATKMEPHNLSNLDGHPVFDALGVESGIMIRRDQVRRRIRRLSGEFRRIWIRSAHCQFEEFWPTVWSTSAEG